MFRGFLGVLYVLHRTQLRSLVHLDLEILHFIPDGLSQLRLVRFRSFRPRRARLTSIFAQRHGFCERLALRSGAQCSQGVIGPLVEVELNMFTLGQLRLFFFIHKVEVAALGWEADNVAVFVQNDSGYLH